MLYTFTLSWAEAFRLCAALCQQKGQQEFDTLTEGRRNSSTDRWIYRQAPQYENGWLGTLSRSAALRQQVDLWGRALFPSTSEWPRTQRNVTECPFVMSSSAL